MDNLEKYLSNLPKPKLSRRADLKIRFKIYHFGVLKNLQKFWQIIFRPHSLLFKVSYTTLIIVVILGSSAVYAANNDNITPGHSLYPLKKTIENVEQSLSFTKQAQVNTLNKLSERRLKEAINLASEDMELDDNGQEASGNIKQNLDELVENLSEAVTITQEIDDQHEAERVKENIKKKNENVIKYLDNLEDIARQKRDHEISDKVDEAKEAIKKYQKMLDDDDEPSFNKDKDSKNKDKDSDNERSENRRDDNDDISSDSEEYDNDRFSDEDKDHD